MSRLDDLTLPLSREKAELLRRLVEGLSPEQTAWVSGYLAGLYAGHRPAAAPVLATEAQPEVTILFGSQTGNARQLARRLQEKLAQAGLRAKVEDLGVYKKNRLKAERRLLIVTSTYGEGEPPDNAKDFHEFLLSGRAPRLEGLQYAVLALGDRGYERFCQTGRDFDARLEALGARRLHPLAECDVDFEETASAWIETVVGRLAEKAGPVPAQVPALSWPALQPALKGEPIYTRKNPYPARLAENIKITGRGSTKDVRHLELAIEGSGLVFEPGDALGVVPRNCPALVEEILATLGLDGAEPVALLKGDETSLAEALARDYEITTLTRPFLERWATLSGAADLAALAREENRDRLRAFLAGREIIDVLQAYPVRGLKGSDFLSALRPLQPRLYSIASSYEADPDTVHLTVGVVRYESHGRTRKGVASTFLAERVAETDTVPVYVHANDNFRLPADPDAPIIMVGAGTGIAPFRAFVETRQARGARGRNWLIFGDRHFRTDFLYQREWLDYRRQGFLQIDVAFSRDSTTKDYVQHRLLDRSRALYAWLEEGAHFYVCGDASRMAPDVHEALIEAVRRESGRSREDAVAYVKELQAAGRYQRDVY